jgi:hypothetical protein
MDRIAGTVLCIVALALFDILVANVAMRMMMMPSDLEVGCGVILLLATAALNYVCSKGIFYVFTKGL